jgi:pullulanase/glycogen debranching enzyme
MLLGGDEIGRTQKGQQQRLLPGQRDLLVRLGRIHGSKVTDIAWFTLEGLQMAEEHWGEGFAKSLGVFLNGKTIPNPNPKGEPVEDDNFYIIFQCPL